MVNVKDWIVVVSEHQFTVGAFASEVANHSYFPIAPPTLRKLIKARLAV